MAVTVAAFDFDGTLTTRDSMWAFLRYYRGSWGYTWRILVLFPWLLAYQAKLLSAQKTKERVLTLFLKGETAEMVYEQGCAFSKHYLPHLLRKSGMERLHWHQTQRHRCILVTASLDIWTQAFAEAHDLTLLATQPQIESGILTGKIMGQNCKGPEKVRRLNGLLAGKAVETTYAYGDSEGDAAMLAWAKHGFYKAFA